MSRHWLLLAVVLLFPVFLAAGNITIDFESFADGDVLTNQISGLTFTNTVVMTAGISLNEIDFPPHSGVNVVSDNGGPLGIVFNTPVLDFSAYFTYVEPLTLTAFDAMHTPLGTALSLFSNNTATAGDPGSSPNELLHVGSLSGISSVSIAGDPSGGSFVMDDVTLTTPGSAVPEPGGGLMMITGIGLAGLLFRLLV